MDCLFLILPITFVIIGAIICIRELYLNYYNPIPKFENDNDKRIDEIEFINIEQNVD